MSNNHMFKLGYLANAATIGSDNAISFAVKKKRVENPDGIDRVIRACMEDPKFAPYDYGKYVSIHGIPQEEENEI